MSIVKYRHPGNRDLTWSGKGRQPKWVEVYLSNGGALISLDAEVQDRDHRLMHDAGIDLDMISLPASKGIDLGIGAAALADSIDVLDGELVTAPPVEAKQVIQADQSANRDLANQLLGQAQAFAAASGLLRTFGVSKLAFVKENKLYKGLEGMRTPNGSESLGGTWEEYCGLLGISVDKADTDIANLRAFGEEALESMSRMGIGYRELRQFRKLPADQREALALIATTGTKDDVLEAAYDLIEKERSAAAEVTVKNAELAEDLKLAEKRAKNLDAECERKDSQIKRLSQAKVRTTEFLIRTEEIREEAMALQFGSELHLNSLKKLFEETDPAAPEGMLQQETLWIVANTIAARALDVIEHMKAIGSPDAQPDRPMQRHLLTPDEAVRWLQDFPLIENRFAAEQALRQEKRDAAKPKGPGRPRLSANKGAEE